MKALQRAPIRLPERTSPSIPNILRIVSDMTPVTSSSYIGLNPWLYKKPKMFSNGRGDGTRSTCIIRSRLHYIICWKIRPVITFIRHNGRSFWRNRRNGTFLRWRARTYIWDWTVATVHFITVLDINSPDYGLGSAETPLTSSLLLLIHFFTVRGRINECLLDDEEEKVGKQ